MIITSVTSASHFSRALVMAKSVREHMPYCRVVICLVEESIPERLRNVRDIHEIVLAKDLGVYKDFYRFIFKHPVRTGVMAHKAAALQYVYNKYVDEEMFIFLDTDMKVLSAFEEIPQLLNEKPIAITSHYCYTQSLSMDAYLQTKKDGMYNSGFVAIKRHEESYKFLKWWAERLEKYCYFDKKKLFFGDQTWLDYVPTFFKSQVILHPGYNVAVWNFKERNVTRIDGKYYVNGFPLRCFHFSCIIKTSLKPVELVPQKKVILQKICDDYNKSLDENHFQTFKSIPWSYDYYKNGRKISKISRQRFKKSLRLQKKYHNPFSWSDSAFVAKSKKTVKKIKKKNKPLRRK